MKKLLLLFIVFLWKALPAQIGFEANTVVAESHATRGAFAAYPADFNGDGNMDVLIAAFLDNKIAWYNNLDGQGNFDYQQIISTETTKAISVFAADIDGDGDMDALSASAQDNKIAWYENTDGNGTFGDQQIISTDALSAEYVFAADLDGDGDMDVLSASLYDNKIAWYENIDGGGTFSDQIVISTTTNFAHVAYAADMDGDGDMDVIAGSHYDLSWFENTDGLGDFSEHHMINDNAVIYSLDIEDVNADGYPDIVTTNGGGELVWYKNLDGAGNFSAKQIISSDVSYPYLNIADVDGDEDMDVVAGGYDGVLAWYENTDGLGNYSAQKIISTEVPGVKTVFVTDINNDGKPDILTASNNNNRIAWYKSLDGQGNFSQQLFITAATFSPSATFAVDIDGDNDLDIISGSRDLIAWYENIDGQGNYAPQHVISTDVSTTKAVFAADLDGDGDMDVLSASADDNKIAWYENTDGMGTFGDQQIILANANGPFAMRATDLDGDGDMDIIAALRFDDKIIWIRNEDGLGTFSGTLTIASGLHNANDVYVSDVDNDGDLDVLAVASGDNKITWYKHLDGAGNFGGEQLVSGSESIPESVRTADIDGDGDMDAIVIGTHRIVWYENMDSQGSFGTAQIVTEEMTNSTTNNLDIADIDADGDMDILSASSSDGKFAWYENIDGLGTFGAQQIITTGDGTNFVGTGIFATDIDANGRADIVTATGVNNSIIWYKNLSLITNEIKGYVRISTLSGECTPSDLPIANLMITTTNGIDSLATFTLSNGFYQLFPEEGDFTTMITGAIPTHYAATPSAFYDSFEGIGQTITDGFCLDPIGAVNDLEITTFPLGAARAGFDITYRIVFKNTGTTSLDGSIMFDYPEDKLSFLSASEIVASQTAGSVNFDYTALNPFESRTIDVSFNIAQLPTVNTGDTLVFNAVINPIADDFTPENNEFQWEQIVVGPLDPNDISVLEGDQIKIEDVDEFLHYIIRFQNIGTASAIHVIVNNTIDEHLDWKTLQLETTSHAVKTTITNGDEIEFSFHNINLPDSTANETASHGFIAYKIKPKTDIVAGDIITNQASIFFDFNPAVMTNTVFTEVVAPTGIAQYDHSFQFSVYPNPAKDVLFIEMKAGTKLLEVYNSVGQLVASVQNSSSIKITELQHGIYWVKVVDVEGNTGVKKVVILN